MSTYEALRDHLVLQLFNATELGIMAITNSRDEMPGVHFVAAEMYVGLRLRDRGYVSVAQADAWGVPFSTVLQAEKRPHDG